MSERCKDCGRTQKAIDQRRGHCLACQDRITCGNCGKLKHPKQPCAHCESALNPGEKP